MKIYFNQLPRKIRLRIPKLRNWIKEILKEYKISKCAELSITFIDNEYMQKLNLAYRNIDKPTDVLTFCLNEDDENNDIEIYSELLGEIYISLEQAEQQAEEFQISYQDELLRLMIHGVLHLLGYTHETPKKEKAIEDLQEKYLNKFNS